MHIHILGICGTFMAGIAAIAKAQGHKVTGCDLNVYPPMSTQLEQLDIEITEGYDVKQVEIKPDIFIIGNVITRGNPLIESILNQQLKYQSGPQWLYENILYNKWVLAVAGTHGKTTTTAMLAWILEANGLAPGFLIGGIPNNFNVSARLPISSEESSPSFFVIEADEYDTAFFDKRSKFIHYRPNTLILNNLEFDHADIFDNIEHIEKHFHHLIRTVPNIGKIIFNDDSLSIIKVLKKGCWSKIEDFGSKGKWSYQKINENEFEVYFEQKSQGNLKWDLIGHHNALNALAAIAAAKHVGISSDNSIKALGEFKNVKKRMELLQSIKGINIYDDFAHHPTAIKTTLEGLRNKINNDRIIAIIEPRSNTMKLGKMKNDLLQSLREADIIFCFSKNLSWNPKILFKNITHATVMEDIDMLANKIYDSCRARDSIIFMSNGGFSGLQNKVVQLLKK
ncbi:UDP-N-acetylmuramate:L-alanyl-gamma-D-glutamyl-meso-diaminopimelate ligase [Methylophilaceae bacterium]|jgi:UDP-N-acetylmuramate: L-alanyl-gamma-D-glutamyl-meso-diaminopimelate ligase|nr:UDP-N-acetylmuramate:L-alanyl-gamma-D-glutamyl-meso-diaminopimelate ligase [Methylophilaceae bacterium]